MKETQTLYTSGLDWVKLDNNISSKNGLYYFELLFKDKTFRYISNDWIETSKAKSKITDKLERFYIKNSKTLNLTEFENLLEI